MKRIVITLIFMITASQAFAQITLTSSINPIPGDVESWAICDTTNISPGTSGSNQTWSYTSLITQDSTTEHYVAPASTPFAAQFPGSNIASTADDFTFNYGTSSSVNFTVNGSGSSSLILRYTDPQMLFQFPFTYGNNFSDNFAANYTIGTTSISETGTSTVSCDAWGTINLPAGSFSNALRIKEVIVTKDSSTGGTPFLSIGTATSYSWYVPGRKFRVFGIVYTSFTYNGLPFGGSKYVNYNNNSSTIGIRNISGITPGNYMLSQNYPNPFNPSTKVRFAVPKAGLVKLTVFDAIGREVETLVNGKLTSGSYEVDWNAGRYSSGIYFYKLQSGEFVETKKMILNK